MLDISDTIDTKGTDKSLADLVSAIEVKPYDLSTLHPVAKSDNIFRENDKRKAWNKDELARCNFEYKLALTRRAGLNFVSIWKKSIMGRTLVDIKSDPDEIEHFASSITPVITDMLGHNLDKGNWCVCTSPKRRHKEKNFATLISERIAQSIGIPFYEDVALCHSKHRMNAVFTLNYLPKEANIIIFDDFVTTGQTLSSMRTLLQPLGKNLIFFTCVNNKL